MKEEVRSCDAGVVMLQGYLWCRDGHGGHDGGGGLGGRRWINMAEGGREMKITIDGVE